LNKKLFAVSGKVSALVAKDLVNNKGYKVYDNNSLVEPFIKTVSLSEQENNESRKVWHKVTVALRTGDDDEANKQKKM